MRQADMQKMTQFDNSIRSNLRAAFTLVEMLVAMAVTLLMMAALARAFGYVGRQVQESRAVTELTSELRDVTSRLHNDLKQCTVKLRANSGLEEDQNGYFLYYEGPLTDATSSLFRVDDSSGQPVLPDSRYGDCDDYLAFTAVAKPGQWFRGKVPKFLVDPLVSAPTTLDDPKFLDLVVIESKYAEIIYFANPEYNETEVGAPQIYRDNDGTIDVDQNGSIEGDEIGNGYPDRLRLYRRVLLIRPDLNVLAADGQFQLAGMSGGNATSRTGMAETVHQRCDLSVRRVLDANTGKPTPRVAANSLSDLSQPHNRFAHHRIDFETPTPHTSMPILALGPPATVLTKVGNVSPNNGSVFTPIDYSGFLRPEFILGGLPRPELEKGQEDFVGRLRRGEDVFTDYLVGFDIQVFDPSLSLVTGAETLDPADAGYRESLANATTVERTGGYVDLGYPVLAGGSVRGWNPIASDSRDQSRPALNRGSLISSFSGLRENLAAFNNISAGNAYADGWYRSGRIFVDKSGGICLQPVFDTFTSHYERDGYFQNWDVGTGVMRWYVSPPINPVTNEFFEVDAGANGLDDYGSYLDVNNNQIQRKFIRRGGADDLGERETLPPFTGEANSVRVSVRLENSKIRLVRQASVEYANP